MVIYKECESKRIVGVLLTTTNDNNKAFKDIPPFWQQFFENKVLERIPQKVSDDIYAVYTCFENEGKNNEGQYSLIIGAEVSSIDSLPNEFVSTIIPSGRYQVFETEKPEKVGEKWQEIWGHTFEKQRTFYAEFEHYKASGEIDIYIGVE